MKVDLLFNTPLWVCAKGIRKCWASEDKSDTISNIRDFIDTDTDEQFLYTDIITGPKDKALIDRIGNKNKHSSVLRHLTYNFDISGMSTKTLLAFTRHKAGVDFSVQSTRYTTSKRADELEFTQTPDSLVNDDSDVIMQIIQTAILRGGSDDDIAMLLPQSYQYSAVVTMNAQAIQHFLMLRTAKSAHYDIRLLASTLYDALPLDHKYLFRHCISGSEENIQYRRDEAAKLLKGLPNVD